MREGKAKERTLKRVVFTNLEEGICNSMVLKKKGGGTDFLFYGGRTYQELSF